MYKWILYKNKLVIYNESRIYIKLNIKNIKYDNIEDIIINKCGKHIKVFVDDYILDANNGWHCEILTQFEKILLNSQELLYI